MFKQKSFFNLLLILIFFVYLFFRFYNLDNYLGFRFDQGVHLLETKFMFDNFEPRLIGPTSSQSFDGRNFFFGANYYYVLGIIGVVSGWNPLIITSLFIVLEGLLYIFFIHFLKNTVGSRLALITFIFISVSPYLVIHSRFFWNPHLLIPLSILCLYFLNKFFANSQPRFLFYSSLIWGFAFACHYTAIFWAFIFFFIIFKLHKVTDPKSYLLISSGFLLGNLPLIIFELRKNFYNLKTMFFVFTNSSQTELFNPHYFIFPLIIFLLFSLLYLSHKYRFVRFLLIFVFIVITAIQFVLFKNYKPIDSIPGWDFHTQSHVANLISQRCPSNFNIAATMQGDTRFHDLRFLLELKNCRPENVENYPTANKLFLVAPISRPPDTETVWEVSSFKPFVVSQKIPLNEHLVLYEMDRI